MGVSKRMSHLQRLQGNLTRRREQGPAIVTPAGYWESYPCLFDHFFQVSVDGKAREPGCVFLFPSDDGLKAKIIEKDLKAYLYRTLGTGDVMLGLEHALEDLEADWRFEALDEAPRRRRRR